MTVYKITIGEKIKVYRWVHHLSQMAFGHMLGISVQAVCKWEQNICYPNIISLSRLARILQCSTDDFFEMYGGDTNE